MSHIEVFNVHHRRCHCGSKVYIQNSVLNLFLLCPFSLLLSFPIMTWSVTKVTPPNLFIWSQFALVNWCCSSVGLWKPWYQGNCGSLKVRDNSISTSIFQLGIMNIKLQQYHHLHIHSEQRFYRKKWLPLFLGAWGRINRSDQSPTTNHTGCQREPECVLRDWLAFGSNTPGSQNHLHKNALQCKTQLSNRIWNL